MRFLASSLFMAVAASVFISCGGNRNLSDDEATANAAGTTPSGIQYEVLQDMSGRNIAIGDYVKMHLVNKTESDSVIFSTYDSNGEPVQFQVSAPQGAGDIMEGITYLSEGDSAVFMVPTDSLFKEGQQRPAFAQTGSMLKYDIKIYEVMTEEEFAKAQAEAQSAQIESETAALEQYFAENNIENVQRTESGLYYKIHKRGEGAQIKSGANATVHYQGRLLSGQEFDSSFKRGQPFSVPVGQGRVIQGWDEGLQHLRVGDSATLYIPSPLGYGERGAGANIPPNSTLIFDIKVLELADPGTRLENEKQAIREYLQANNIQAQEHPTGLFYAIHERGAGATPQPGQTVVVHYRGKLLNGQEFDASYNRGQPFEFPLGQGRVIKGWDVGIGLLPVGTKATLFLPSSLGYGERGAGANIPPNSILIFDVELLDVK